MNKIPENCYTSYSRINTKLLSVILEKKKMILDLSNDEIRQKILKTSTRTITYIK